MSAFLVYPAPSRAGSKTMLSAATLNGHEEGDHEHETKIYVSLDSNKVEGCIQSFTDYIEKKIQEQDSSTWMYNWLVIDLVEWYRAKGFKRGIDYFSRSWDAMAPSDNQVMEIREKLAQLQTQMVFFTFLSELYF